MVKLSANPAIIKAERTQAKFAENEEQRAEFYRQATLDYTQTTSNLTVPKHSETTSDNYRQ